MQLMYMCTYTLLFVLSAVCVYDAILNEFSSIITAFQWRAGCCCSDWQLAGGPYTKGWTVR